MTPVYLSTRKAKSPRLFQPRPSFNFRPENSSKIVEKLTILHPFCATGNFYQSQAPSCFYAMTSS